MLKDHISSLSENDGSFTNFWDKAAVSTLTSSRVSVAGTPARNLQYTDTKKTLCSKRAALENPGLQSDKDLAKSIQKPHVGFTYLDYNQFEGTAASIVGAADSTAALRLLYDKLFQPKTTKGHMDAYGQDELTRDGQFILFSIASTDDYETHVTFNQNHYASYSTHYLTLRARYVPWDAACTRLQQSPDA